MVHQQHPYLLDVWCPMDGLNLMLEQSGDAFIHEEFYNGWTHNHYVMSVMCFCPDGTILIVFAIFLAPFMIPKLQIMETYTTNLSWCIYETVQNALLIQRLGM